MIKKIKELTVEEMSKICNNRTGCSGCPLDLINAPMCIFSIVRNRLKEKLEEEVEVDE